LPRTVAVRAKWTSGVGAVAIQRAARRERALAMVCKLHCDSEAVRRGRSRIMWCPVGTIVKRPRDDDVPPRGTGIDLSPGAHRVRVTESGRSPSKGRKGTPSAIGPGFISLAGDRQLTDDANAPHMDFFPVIRGSSSSLRRS